MPFESSVFWRYDNRFQIQSPVPVGFGIEVRCFHMVDYRHYHDHGNSQSRPGNVNAAE